MKSLTGMVTMSIFVLLATAVPEAFLPFAAGGALASAITVGVDLADEAPAALRPAETGSGPVGAMWSG
jgi:hypothetical protein